MNISDNRFLVLRHLVSSSWVQPSCRPLSLHRLTSSSSSSASDLSQPEANLPIRTHTAIFSLRLTLATISPRAHGRCTSEKIAHNLLWLSVLSQRRELLVLS
ncbi:hypothetical protein RRG08_011154 [Elysia crispata]|uniref:Uncharacterized protein n=1 Tax=Elysia crispata TaxID=231223 RepID=A0AAE1DR11_9GAST|nr:hypothetical protein RRG08_011154 [Elysia crispata]